MNLPQFTNLSIWEQLGVIGSIASVIGLYSFFTRPKPGTKINNSYQQSADKIINQNKEINTSINIEGNVSGAKIVAGDYIGVSPEVMNQIVTTLTNKHQLDAQAKM